MGWWVMDGRRSLPLSRYWLYFSIVAGLTMRCDAMMQGRDGVLQEVSSWRFWFGVARLGPKTGDRELEWWGGLLPRHRRRRRRAQWALKIFAKVVGM